ncbi:glycogen phosphorylase, partial [Striga asiatica]
MNSQDENILGMSQIENATEMNECFNRTLHTIQKDASTSPPASQKNGVSLSYQQLLNASMYPFQPTHIYLAQNAHAQRKKKKKAKTKDNDFISSQTLEKDKFNKSWSKNEDIALTKA